ncbi:g4311 [Coccomyxa elongata]
MDYRAPYSNGDSGRVLRSSEAQRNSEALFESQTIVEIREVETKSKVDIEDKKKQLRQLVGNSYRDFISSADTILDMATCCNGVVVTLKQIQGGLADFKAAVSQDKQGAKQHSGSSEERQALYSLGGRVKYLVDTPEIIWGCLDAREFLAAARRLLCASHVHAALMSGPPRPLLDRRFPLVAHLWPNVEKFRAQILELARQWLRSEAMLPPVEAANTLVAVAFLQDMNTAQVLEVFLDARRAWIVGVLEAAAEKGPLPVHELSNTLAHVSSQMQETVCAAGELFLSGVSGLKRQPLLPEAAATDGLAGAELLFGPMPGGQPGTSDADAWQARSSEMAGRMAALPATEAAAACSHWLERVAAEARPALGRLLTGCAAAAALSGAEESLQAAIGAWRHKTLAEEPISDVLSPSSRTPHSARSDAFSPFASVQLDAGVNTGAVPQIWEGVCEWVLGRRVDLWETAFEPVFLQRAKELIQESFHGILAALDQPLSSSLEAAKHANVAPAGAYQAPSWSEDAPPFAPATPTRTARWKRSRRASADDSTDAAAAAAAAADPGSGAADTGASRNWRAHVRELQTIMDGGLRDALSGALLLLKEAAREKQRSGWEQWSSRTSGSRAARAPTGRAAALQPHIQQACAAAAAAVASSLESRLGALPPVAAGHAGATVVEQALLLGRLSASFGSSHTFLPVVLGPPEEWRSALSVSTAKAGALQAPATSRPAPAGQQLESLQSKFGAVALEAHGIWARWAAAALGRQLAASLEQDPALTSHVPLRTWIDTVVKHEDELGGAAEEMRFALPAAASPAAQAALLGSCREVARAGGHAVAEPALALLAWELGEAVLTAFRDALQLGSPLDRAVTEKGVLQLLFDLRFLRNSLAGGRPAAATISGGVPSAGSSAPGSAALSQRKRAFTDVESSLQERLDPIDWATYEPYLWANEASMRPRTAVLYGLIARLARAEGYGSGSATAAAPALGRGGAPAGEANVMAAAPQAPRFAYLPISTPSIGGPSGTRRPGASPSGTPTYAGMEKALGDYSFSGLSSSRGEEGSLAEQAAQSAAASTFEALQSKITSQSQRLGVFGSMLGDKAAEVTAMAQQSFGDISLPSALTSALGTAATDRSAAGLLSTFRGSFHTTGTT